MNIKIIQYLKYIALLFCFAMYFSCNDATEDVSNIESESYCFPIGEARDFRLIYTDSSKIKAILESPESLNFTNQNFPYWEFPKGLIITFFDNKKNKNTISSKYAIYYENTRIAEFRDSVEIYTFEGKILKTNKLFWNEALNWVFTKEAFTFIDTTKQSITKGIGMDFNQNFTKLKAYKITGVLPIKESKENF